jgi:uncharacterized protein (TIGR03435 family)
MSAPSTWSNASEPFGPIQYHSNPHGLDTPLVNTRVKISIALRALSIGIAVWGTHAQTTSPAFEVVSIKPAPLQALGRTSTRMSTDQGRLTYTNVTLSDIIAQAYHVQHMQISGPEWMDSERFDILAKIPDGVPGSQIPQMLQGLLSDRFNLKLHIAKKELPVYVLSVLKSGPKIRKVESSGGLSIGGNSGRIHLNGNVTMAWLADYLSGRLGRTMLDQTGLEGPYAVALDWVTDQAADAATGPTLMTALQEQLGLKLTAAKSPVEVLVIDRVEKSPTAN